jgi:limonene 1,2-monooxygenase
LLRTGNQFKLLRKRQQELLLMTPQLTPMRFGLFMQPVHHPRENPTLSLERDLELIEHLDRLGFDEVWIGEHHSTGWEPIPSPEIMIAAAAARTRHIRFGSGVVPLSIHHPLFVVENFALLDHLTRGRVILGMGAGGGLPTDPYVLGLEHSAQQPRFMQAFKVIHHLLTSLEPISLKTDWFELRDAVLQLRSFTHPHIPLALVSDTNTQTLELVGKHGTMWLTSLLPQKFDASWKIVERAALEAERTPDRSGIRLAINLHLAETRAQALEDVRVGSAVERFDFSTPVTGSPLPDMPREKWVEELAGRPTDIIGTPDDAIEQIEAIQHATGGVGGLIIRSKEWANRETKWRSFELFARYVMPHFQGSLVGLRAAETIARNIIERHRNHS